MKEDTGYLCYIRKCAEHQGKDEVSMQIYPNQAKRLREYGFKVTAKDNPKKVYKNKKRWYSISCKEAIRGTKAWDMFGIVLAYRRSRAEKNKR